MSSLLLHPGLVLIAGGLLLGIVRGKLRPVLVLALPLVCLYFIWRLPDGLGPRIDFLGFELAPLAPDKLSRLFATIFGIMAFAGGLFALNQKNVLEVPAALIYAGAAIGVALAGDLVTVFIFWEVMALGSTLVIWSAGA